MWTILSWMSPCFEMRTNFMVEARKETYRVPFSFIFFLFLMLWSQKYLQASNSLQCTSNNNFKLATTQIQSCIISIAIPVLFLLLKKLPDFKRTKVKITQITLLLSSFKHSGAIIWTKVIWLWIGTSLREIF